MNLREFITAPLRSILAAGTAFFLAVNPSPAQQLFWHPVRLDQQGKLLSWIDSDAPYAEILRLDWEMFKAIPVQSNGLRTYFTYPEFNGLNDPGQPFFAGRPWAHNPAGLFAMLTDSALLYHAYSGDRSVMDRVREMLAHMLLYGTTEASDSWAQVPYSSSDAGNPV